VIDVGVGAAPLALRSFPGARFAFRALDVLCRRWKSLQKQSTPVITWTALGSEPGVANIDVNTEDPTSSTMAGYSSNFRS